MCCVRWPRPPTSKCSTNVTVWPVLIGGIGSYARLGRITAVTLRPPPAAAGSGVRSPADSVQTQLGRWTVISAAVGSTVIQRQQSGCSSSSLWFKQIYGKGTQWRQFAPAGCLISDAVEEVTAQGMVKRYGVCSTIACCFTMLTDGHPSSFAAGP